MLPTYRLEGWNFDESTRMWYGYRFDVGSIPVIGEAGKLLYVKESEVDRRLVERFLRFETEREYKEGDVVVIDGDTYVLAKEFGQ